jgi:uncharacterized protein (DUF1800 family)
MDRRYFLTAWREKMEAANASNHLATTTVNTASSPTASLLPYTGIWTKKEVTHLLRRATFGVKKSDVTTFLALNPSQAVDKLLIAEAMPANPVNDFERSYYGNDAIDGAAAPGADWTGTTSEGNMWFRHLSYNVWVLKNALNQPATIREKMTLFWSNHFGTSIILGGGLADQRRVFKHHNLLRTNALGNVKTLVNLVTKDPLMLEFLNGESNTKYDPNENYARELQELFVVGKYPSQQYTENDVREAAKILTGWKFDQPFNTKFVPEDHDTSNKTFSAFYGNRVINGNAGANGGQTELDQLINMLFVTVDSAKFICRKLYRFFVQYKIMPDTETTVIVPLATTFINNNFEIKPVLAQLFKSQHFFDVAYNQAALIKSPFDLYVGLMKTFRTQLFSPTVITNVFEKLSEISYKLQDAEMPIAEPPNVAGFPAYTSPLFDKYWISTVTLPRRVNHINDMLFNQAYPFYDIMGFTNALDTPANPNLLISETLELLYAIPVNVEVTNYLKSILLSGQADDSYWTSAWLAYKANPTDPAAYGTVYNRLVNFYNYLINLEEIHLM